MVLKKNIPNIISLTVNIIRFDENPTNFPNYELGQIEKVLNEVRVPKIQEIISTGTFIETRAGDKYINIHF